ncbi:MAG TPA: tripartite tricarboxylate transporter substrate binding protein [Burkholderiaceae bacterium]|nr:tripartite tricarboxylate transporter substrate binding protein [Burkholderiaceae bacterium]
MKMIRQLTLAVACAGALFGARAADFPTKPIELVVPFSPGGPTDAMARLLASAMKSSLGQPVIVVNKAGAGGNIGAEMVAHANPDGQTLLFGTSGPLAINVSVYPKIGYDPIKSFAPVIKVGYLPDVLIVNPKVPAKTVAELIAYGRAHPGKLTFGSSGNGASSHLAGVLFNNVAGTDFLHIPYKGTGPALTALLAGQVSMAFTDVLTAVPYIQSGKLRVLGVTTKERSQALPDVPTVAEQGVNGFDVSVFFGIVAPAGTPKPVIDKLNSAFADALKQPDVRKKLLAQGLEFSSSTAPEELAGFVRSEVDKWHAVVSKSGAKLK